MKKKNKDKKEENSLHREYGVMNNTGYMLKKARQYRPALLAIMGLGALSQSPPAEHRRGRRRYCAACTYSYSDSINTACVPQRLYSLQQ